MIKKIANFTINYRFPIVIFTILVTLILAYQIRHVSFRTVLGTTLPLKHPYVQIHIKFMEIFGGANTMLIGLEAKNGDIFDHKILKKIKTITDEVKFHPDAITSQVISIARKKVKNIRGVGGGLDIQPFYRGGKVPETPEEVKRLREEIYSNEAIRGYFVSMDGTAALIISNFKEGIDYHKLFKDLQKIIKDVAGDDLNVYISGRPMLLGWIYNNNPKSVKIFIGSLIAEMIVLSIFLSRFNWALIPFPLILGLINAVWGLGIMGILRFNLDPLGLVIPFVIGARVISHSVQLTERFGEDYLKLKDSKEAAKSTLETMFVPSSTSIITDAAGLYIISIVPIPLLQILGIIAGTWLLSAIVGVSLLNPIVFSYVKHPLKLRKSEPGLDFLGRILHGAGVWLMEKKRNIAIVLIVWLIIFVVSIGLSTKLEVGDPHPGSSLLWPESRYNTDDKNLNEKFPGTNPLFVIMQGKHNDVLKEPRVLNTVEAFQLKMRECAGFGGTESLVEIIKKLNREFHEGDPKWAVIPNTKDDIAFYIFMYLSKGEPGDFDRYSDLKYKNGNIIYYFKDHKGSTIKNAVDKAKDFLNEYNIPREHLDFKLAGGIMGVTAAVNEVVGKYNHLILFLALGVIYICCVIPYRSLTRGFILLVSLITANFISMAYMVLAKMGMTINVLPVAAIGAGLGVDYGIYMLSRIGDEYNILKDWKKSIIITFGTTGRAVVVTGITVIVGIIFWYFSDLRFQAEIGFLLAFLLAMNVFGAIFLVPTLTYLIRPKFLVDR
ncbi:MAG: MMPL family transporter [Thermodesulfobacteriota bacterium]|nr:MMPL family transporter [Thermodesulfobacteriota bacterium]